METLVKTEVLQRKRCGGRGEKQSSRTRSRSQDSSQLDLRRGCPHGRETCSHQPETQLLPVISPDTGMLSSG
ncbi:hypothetical protein TREES_T100015662 [Tupaia chinensis]|uniref:Uncharacterized protein n=1 Tax=Tupaia chinensis TaxID=246437 RepID=L9L7X3_TUPCH|nr:hypothetical protein TREES_T100015662 [Tupaia chinensis]